MLDQRGRLLVAALGFAGCVMPSYDRALWADQVIELQTAGAVRRAPDV